MFNTTTVFILGAGASWHYGYPTGEELVRLVQDKASELAQFFQFPSPHKTTIVPEFVSICPASKQREERYDNWTARAGQARELARRLREVNPTVIDYFLKQNSDLHEIGKLAIAMVIFDCEAAFRLSRGNPNRVKLYDLQVKRGMAAPNIRVTPTSFSDDWIRFIIYKLTSRCKQSSDLLQNKVTFVTFNYDTSLEQRIYEGLSGISFFQQQHIEEFLDSGRIVHVYGRVRDGADWREAATGSLLSTLDDSHSLQEAQRIMDLHYRASLGIRTIDGPEKEANSESLDRCRKVISEAYKLFILGYGFDALNGERIDLGALKGWPPHDRFVFFTNFGGHNRVSMAASRVMFGGQDLFMPPNLPIRSKQQLVDNNYHNFRWEMSTKNVYDALNEDFESLEAD